MKILIIQHDIQLGQELKDFFIRNHYDVELVDNTTQAKSHIKSISDSDNVDVVLIDFDQNSKENYKLINFIQQDKTPIPFIFMADCNIINNIIYKIERGFWNYVAKPILNLDTLLVAVEQLTHQCYLLKANQLFKDELSEKHKELKSDYIAGQNLLNQLLPENNKSILNLKFNYFSYPSLYISGDFVDYQQLSDRYLIFYLADVSGHGVSSAFVTMLLKSSINKYTTEFIQNDNPIIIQPANLLSCINKSLCAEKTGKYLTIVYMVYDKYENVIRYCVAGHLPFPVYIEHKKSAEYIGERGYPVGMFNEASYEEQVLNIDQDFKLAIFSDGILELLPQEKLQDKENLILNILDNYQNQDIEQIKKYLRVEKRDNLPDDVSGLFVSVE